MPKKSDCNLTSVGLQDEVKSSDTENEAEVLVAQIQQSPEGIATVHIPRDSFQINLPHGTVTDSTTAHVPEVERVDVNTCGNHGNTIEIPLESSSTLPDASAQSEVMEKGGLSPYMDNQSSSEQDEGNGDTYPESTINLQDLR